MYNKFGNNYMVYMINICPPKKYNANQIIYIKLVFQKKSNPIIK